MNTSGSLVGSICAVAFCTFAVLFPIGAARILWINRKKLTTPLFAQRFGTLGDRLSGRSYASLLGVVIQLVRLFVSVIILVKLRDYPGVQIMALLGVAICYQGYLVSVKPYEEPRENKAALMNEFFVSLYLYATLLLTDFNLKGKWRNETAMLMLATLLTSIGFNVLEMVIRGIRKVWPRLKARFCKMEKEPKKLKKAKKGKQKKERVNKTLAMLQKASAHPRTLIQDIMLEDPEKFGNEYVQDYEEEEIKDIE